MAQTFTLGAASDPCVGGAPWSFNGAIPTLRFGTFNCTFDAGGSGNYIVELDFVEPATTNPATAVDGRLFSATITDAWASAVYGSMNNIDLVTMGATSPAIVISRKFMVLSSDGKIRVNLITVKRSAVLSRVIISRVGLGAQTGQVVDFSPLGIAASTLKATNTTPPFGQFLVATPAPTSTVLDGVTYDGVLFLDKADMRLKLLLKDGTTQPLALGSMTMQRATKASTTLGIDMWTWTPVGASAQKLIGVAPTPEALALPTCPASGTCWQKQ